MSIYQAEGNTLSSSKFQKQLNLETKISDMAEGGLQHRPIKNYTTLLPDMILDIVFAFYVIFYF